MSYVNHYRDGRYPSATVRKGVSYFGYAAGYLLGIGADDTSNFATSLHDRYFNAKTEFHQSKLMHVRRARRSIGRRVVRPTYRARRRISRAPRRRVPVSRRRYRR